MKIFEFARPNISSLVPYRCARDDFSDGILLDANENSFGSVLIDEQNLNRYPDPYQLQLKKSMAEWRGINSVNQIFTGVGSDEAIDLLMRVFCIPGKDAILICPPTYGMYKVSANINDIDIVKVQLSPEFQIYPEKIIQEVKKSKLTGKQIKLVFICSPGNPTGTYIKKAHLLSLLDDPDFEAILVVDEAYIDFVEGESPSMTQYLDKYNNLVVLQTFSKSFGLAGIRLGFAFGSEDIISLMNRAKPPYNISQPTSKLANDALTPASMNILKTNISRILQERAELYNLFQNKLPGIESILGKQDANFLLVRIKLPPISKRSQFEVSYTNSDLDKESELRNAFANWIYLNLAKNKSIAIVVRFRGNEPLCSGCLRITVGNKEENSLLEKYWNEIVGPVFNN